MNVFTYEEAHADLTRVMDSACLHRGPAIITRESGGPVVVMPLDEFNSLQETLYLLGNLENARRLRESVGQLKAGKTQVREFPIETKPE